ncbi:MAG: hypothetical protein IJ804_04415 [Prevotella sp.]|nr:hypothetical protein [Prevotella sp.]MBR1879978.1 hypothetical protein [Prevotella sp.]
MNKKRMVLSLMAMACVLSFSAQTERTRAFDNLYHFIENLDVFEYGQEEARAYYIPGHHVLLNGRWKFCYADTPQEIPENFFEEKFSDAKWSTIDVPSTSRASHTSSITTVFPLVATASVALPPSASSSA